METIAAILGYILSNPTGLIIVAIIAGIYYGILPILNMYRCHTTVKKYQKLGGVEQWTFRKCLSVKVKSMTWDKVFKPSRYSRKKIPVKTQILQYWKLIKAWFSDWVSAIQSYSPRTHMKDMKKLQGLVNSYMTQYHDYRNKYNTLHDDCRTLMEYIDNQIPDTKIKFDDILAAAKKEQVKKDKENAEKQGLDLEINDKHQVSLFA